MIPERHTAIGYLEELTWKGAKERFGETLSGKVITILTHELDLIKTLEFADYFLTVWDIVTWARSQDILCQGRGSAANSAVCFVLGITSVDPTLFDLLFERFISMERGDPPDIDVDFEHERREEVIQYIYRRYGRDRAAMVANVITYRSKGAMRAVGKALGASEALLGRMSKMASSKFFRGSGTQNIIQNLKAKSLPSGLWSDLSERLKTFPRHLGIHSGGFMLSNTPLTSLVPLEPATMADRTVVQWCKDDIEGLGFFKIDVLSLGMLSAIRKCFHDVEDKYGRKLSLYGIPKDDAATFSMIQRADTAGTFQIESRAQMSMLPRLRPQCFYDLVIEVAIVRPGPIQGKVIHPYLARRQGKEPIVFPDERLRPILARTLGVAIFQEQAMRIAIAVGDFSPGEANELRKNIGTWNMKEFERNLDPWLEKLQRGMKKNKIKEPFASQILGQMRGFANYGFPESHAVSFALIAYASSYLKCHYPAPFFTSILNSQPMGFYSPHALLQAAQRNGVKIHPISINDSDWDHKLEKISKPKTPPVYAIRLGFRLVCGLSKTAGQKIPRHRSQEGPWPTFSAFIKTSLLFRDDFTALAAANAFQEFGLTRSEAIWQAEAVPVPPLVDIEERKINWQLGSKLSQIQQDFSAFKTTLETHPVRVLREENWTFPIPTSTLATAVTLSKTKRDQLVTVFGMTLIKQAPPTANGMVFVTLEDDTGFLNLVFSPDIYARYYPIVDQHPFLCVKGKLQRTNESHSILVGQVYVPERVGNVVDIGAERKRLAGAYVVECG